MSIEPENISQRKGRENAGAPQAAAAHEVPESGQAGGSPDRSTDRYVDRELSWLAFNGRVIQEANDPGVPLFERLKFLAIYSSNLDEFFRVRVAALRSLLQLGKKSRKSLSLNPDELLQKIHQTVQNQQDLVGQIYRDRILPELAAHGIRLVRGNRLSDDQKRFLAVWFEENVLPILSATFIREGFGGPFLHNRRLYLIVQLRPRLARRHWSEGDAPVPEEEPELPLAVVEIPSVHLPRFVVLPSLPGEHAVIALDDVMRLNMARVFPGFDPVDSWAVKLTRDAELYIDDEFSGDLVKKIRKGLHKRETGVPSRFLYDRMMPKGVMKAVRKAFELRDEDLFAGWRYHNFSDLFSFPFPDMPELLYEPLPPLPHPVLAGAANFFEEIARNDQILHFPYHSYDPVLHFLNEAATDPDVESIFITLYRVAGNSAIARTLIEGVKNGKKVTAFVEVKARFDEESNIYWAGEMEAAGVRVLYSFPGLKVHSKLCLVERREGETLRRYAYLSTGNFNEKTATLYCDHSLLTADPRLTDEVEQVFWFLCGKESSPVFHHLLVAPFTLRRRLLELVDREIANAHAGQPASILLKLNGLEDLEMVEKLYEASGAGVDVRLIVRGICCLKPGVPGLSENVRGISIVDRFLEHGRIYLFHNGGSEDLYVSSADWMTRNLSRRVEVAFPIYDAAIRAELRNMLHLQWSDNVKARILDADMSNQYRGAEDQNRDYQQAPVRAQVLSYQVVGEGGE